MIVNPKSRSTLILCDIIKGGLLLESNIVEENLIKIMLALRCIATYIRPDKINNVHTPKSSKKKNINLHSV